MTSFFGASAWDARQADQPDSLDPSLQKAQQIHTTAQQSYERIRANRNLSPAGKARQMAPVYLSAKKQLADHETAVKAATAAKKTQLARAAFGVPSDPIEAMSYRNALGLAEQITDPRTAASKLSRALDTGDPIMAQAIAQHASDQGWPDVLDTYTAAKPEAGDALNQLNQMNAQQANPRRVLEAGAYYRMTPPDELGRMDDWKIAELAATPLDSA